MCNNKRRCKITIIITAVIMFLLGLAIGSFLNVCIYRIPMGKSIVFPPSACPKCKKSIKWYDNIPVFSFAMLKGRCRSCSTKISIQYPIVELLTGLLFVIFFLKFGLEKIYFFYIIMIGYTITLAFIDYEKKMVPDVIVLFLLITGMIFGVFGTNPAVNLFEGVIGALTGGLAILFLYFFSNEKIGEGDIKLIAALGFCTGLKEIAGIILYAFIIGGVVSAILLFSGRFKRTDSVPFVPFITAAFLIRALIF
jgi:leader peptidase (prepilin peptidase) / N-methyltransferase